MTDNKDDDLMRHWGEGLIERNEPTTLKGWIMKILKVIGIVAVLMFGMATESAAQGPYSAPPVQQQTPGTSPYVPGNLGEDYVYTVIHRYGNVFTGQAGAANDYQSYLAIGSDVNQHVRVTIKGAGAPFDMVVFVPAGSRGPQENGQPLFLNALAGLKGFMGAISVKVELEHPAEVSIAMHPAGNFWHGVVMALETGEK